MMTRKEKEKVEHRRLILDAAEAVFAQKGYHNAGMQEIAERAEFSVGYIYGLFASKQEIFSELMDMRAAEYISQVQKQLKEQPAVLDKVRTAVAAKLDFFRTHQQFFLIFSHLVAPDQSEGVPVMAESCRKRYQRYKERLAEIFREGMRQGLFVEADPMTVASCLEGMTNAAIEQWVFSGGKLDAPAPGVIEHILLEGILAKGGA